MKLGVITDGISRDLETALREMEQQDIEYAELQFVGEKEIGDQTKEETAQIKKLLKKYQRKVSCITRHNFAGFPALEVQKGDQVYNKHKESLQRCFNLAHELDAPLVRIMSPKKEMILFGSHGAETWVTATGVWDAFIALMEEPAAMAAKEGIPLVSETCNGNMITSNFLASQMIQEVGSDDLHILWDPCNALYCSERPYPEGYQAGKGRIRHIHIKDAKIHIPRASVEFRSLGQGDMAPYLVDIASALKRDGYQGVISLEANYRPQGKEFRDGFHSSLRTFKEIFGN